MIFCRLKRVPGEVAHADEGESGLLHQSDVAMNLFRRAVDGLIAGADKELTMAEPVRMLGGAWGSALGGAGGKEESTAQKHRGKDGESFQGGFLLLMHCGGKFRCRISGQNGIPEGGHLVISSSTGMNFVSRKICWVGENGVDVGKFYFVVVSLFLRNDSGEHRIIGIDVGIPGLNFRNGRNAGQNHGSVWILLENSTHESLHCLTHPIRWRDAKNIVGSKQNQDDIGIVIFEGGLDRKRRVLLRRAAVQEHADAGTAISLVIRIFHASRESSVVGGISIVFLADKGNGITVVLEHPIKRLSISPLRIFSLRN